MTWRQQMCSERLIGQFLFEDRKIKSTFLLNWKFISDMGMRVVWSSIFYIYVFPCHFSVPCYTTTILKSQYHVQNAFVLVNEGMTSYRLQRAIPLKSEKMSYCIPWHYFLVLHHFESHNIASGVLQNIGKFPFWFGKFNIILQKIHFCTPANQDSLQVHEKYVAK